MLQVLGYCISQLSTQKKTDKGVHIPYRFLGFGNKISRDG